MWMRISYAKTNVPTQTWLWGCLSVQTLFQKATLSEPEDKGLESNLIDFSIHEELLHIESEGLMFIQKWRNGMKTRKS